MTGKRGNVSGWRVHDREESVWERERERRKRRERERSEKIVTSRGRIGGRCKSGTVD